MHIELHTLFSVTHWELKCSNTHQSNVTVGKGISAVPVRIRLHVVENVQLWYFCGTDLCTNHGFSTRVCTRVPQPSIKKINITNNDSPHPSTQLALKCFNKCLTTSCEQTTKKTWIFSQTGKCSHVVMTLLTCPQCQGTASDQHLQADPNRVQMTSYVWFTKKKVNRSLQS